MNKTWSIILIVVACIVVLGGTYWYFGMQKPKTQEGTTTTAVVDPIKDMPAVAKEGPIVSPTVQAGSPHPKIVPEPEEQIVESSSLPAKGQKGKPLPSPLAAITSKGGGFSLPTLDLQSVGMIAEQGKSTSVLASEALPVKLDTTMLPAMDQGESADDTIDIPPVVGESTEPLLEAEQVAPAEKVVSPPENKILKSATVAMDEPETKEKRVGMEGNLSISFLDYNFPKKFTSPEKSFSVSMDILSQKGIFGWGGTLEVGKTDSTDIVLVSLLAKTVWTLGKGVVTFPLSVSLGPTLFIDSTAKTTDLGMKAKLGAGLTYAISESFRIFYAIGVGVTYNFQDSTSFRFVMEPLRMGVGFSF